MLGIRVVVPKVLRDRVLTELHQIHNRVQERCVLLFSEDTMHCHMVCVQETCVLLFSEDTR